MIRIVDDVNVSVQISAELVELKIEKLVFKNQLEQMSSQHKIEKLKLYVVN